MRKIIAWQQMSFNETDMVEYMNLVVSKLNEGFEILEKNSAIVRLTDNETGGMKSVWAYTFILVKYED